ncbi:hypothetical protein MMC17_001734 [Xylographa soralifera]|nr:hypothetical protein [Xylographa soralifera]
MSKTPLTASREPVRSLKRKLSQLSTSEHPERGSKTRSKRRLQAPSPSISDDDICDQLDRIRHCGYRHRRYSDTCLSWSKRRSHLVRSGSFDVHRDKQTTIAPAIDTLSPLALSQATFGDSHASSDSHSSLPSPAASDSAASSSAANSPLPSPSAVDSPFYREDVLKPRHIQIDPLGDSIPEDIGRLVRQRILKPRTSLEPTDEQCAVFQQEIKAALDGEIEDKDRAHNAFLAFLFPQSSMPAGLSIGKNTRTGGSVMGFELPSD